MKKTLAVVASSCALISLTQAQVINQAVLVSNSSSPYVVVSRDANSAIWQQQTYEKTPKGTIVTNTHGYVELATGLNFWKNGWWNVSKEQIDISADGSSAEAVNGQHQAYFPGDIGSGVIKLVMPDGKPLRSQPIGLSYYDGSNSVLLAEVTNSTGAILSTGNQVIYKNAFAGLNADLLYTYTKAGFEQDVILRQQPPDPASLGLNPQTTRLQVVTEFLKPPRPDIKVSTAPTDAGDLEDDSLDFGSMQMGQGKAFSVGDKSTSVGVNKRWMLIKGRQFLIEEVPIVSVASAIDSLPPFAKAGPVTTKPVVSKNLILPPPRLVRSSPQNKFVAQATVPTQGLVLDYVAVTSQANWTFHGDTTYYVSGSVALSGTDTFEGGTVIKYTNNAMITLAGAAVNWLAGPYRPVIFTAWNDNSVGDTISGSLGNPTNNCANAALRILFPTTFNQPISNFRIAYAVQAIWLSGSVNYSFYDGQIVNCQNGFYGQNNIRSYLRNILFTGVQTNFNNLQTSTFDVQNGTFNSSSYLSTVAGLGFTSMTLKFTNCIFANITALTNNPSGVTLTYQILGGTNGFYSCPPFGLGQVTNNSNPFQTAGAGYYYLTNGCNFLNAGTTNIDPVLLASLAQLTTYAPTNVYFNKTISGGTWTPQVQRDTNALPTLGYHYAPIDYAVSWVTVNGTLTLNNGVAVASFQGSSGPPAPGFMVGTGDQLTSIGTAPVHNQIFHYAAVQEEPILWGGNAFGNAILVFAGTSYYTTPATLYARFTDLSGLAGLGAGTVFSYNSPSGTKIGGGDPMEFNLRDCRVGPGWLTCSTYQGNDTNLCFNNLFDRAGIEISDFDGDSLVVMQNNLFHNGYVLFDNETQAYQWTVENNFFDNCTNTQFGGGLSEDHNGYWNATQLTPNGAGDVLLTNFIYASGPLGGNYYQVSTNLLNQGSTTAALLGLYHYTVQTNLVGGAEVAEGNNTVSIGFHYVATYANGIPLDTDGDGVPDYLEDSNGNGVYDAGDLGNWLLSPFNGLSSSNRLQVFTPLK